MDGRLLATASAGNIVLRIIALLLLARVALIQFRQFQYKSSLQPLKRILFYIPISIAITNIPQFMLSWGRIFGDNGGTQLTSVATLSNGFSVFLTAVLLLMVYHYRGDV